LLAQSLIACFPLSRRFLDYWVYQVRIQESESGCAKSKKGAEKEEKNNDLVGIGFQPKLVQRKRK
jgi:hypothetical protein